MEVQRKQAPIMIRISYVDYRRYLEIAVDLDGKYPWLGQHQYWMDIATVDDHGVTLKLGRICQAEGI